jgi:O-antigen/teichoic acid export membrane protein
MSRLQSDSKEMLKAYRWMLTRSAILTLPAMVGFGVLAPDAVPAIYGQKWVEAGQLAQILALLVLPYLLSSFASPLLMALGRGSSLQTLALGNLVATVVFTAASAPFGLTVVVLVSVARAYLALPFQMWFLKRASGITPRDSLSAIAAPLAASAIMGAAVWLLMDIIRPYFSSPLVAVFICVAAGMLIYVIAIYAISAQARHMVGYCLRVLREKR